MFPLRQLDMPHAKAVSMTECGGIEGSAKTQAFTTVEARDMFAAAAKIVGSYKRAHPEEIASG